MSGAEMPFDIKNISTKSGIYLFSDKSNNIIYIGKAINLRSRVKSYWSQSSWKDRPKLAVLVPQIKHCETILTLNEHEALLLEANLIYKHQPKYNVLLKDNKNFPWLAITYGEDFPRLIVVRNIKALKRQFPQAKTFGPYTDSNQMYKIQNIALDLFMLRRRAKPLYNYKPCLNFHINKCLAPCQKKVSIEQYNSMLSQLELFLGGRHEDLVQILTEKMLQASEEQEYEQATKYRDQIEIIKFNLEEQRIITDNIQVKRDVIAFAEMNNTMCLQIFKIRYGKLIGRENYFINLNNYQELQESLYSGITQAYINRAVDDLPREVCLQVEAQEIINKLQEFFLVISDKYKIKILIPKQGAKKEQLELVQENTEASLQAQQKVKTKNIQALQELQEILKLNILPNIIDCFDISHLQGTEVVASCVQLKENIPNKSQYRRLKMSIDQNNDFASMREALIKRYTRKRDLPDLILIDGGKGQLSSAYEALQELKLENKVQIISLAKKLEEIYLITGDKVSLSHSSPALQVLQRARDEAHRFALTYQRKRRQMKGDFN